jgi:hypothetical protein
MSETTNKRKNQIYGNWVVYSHKGEKAFLCLEERAQWYLSRNLAIKISDNPPSIQMLFEMKGEGHKDDNYYLSSKQNKCVKCGTEDLEVLTKHHVVPQMYRKFMPLDIKSRSSFDVLPMCFDCHDDYERFADILKLELAEKYNAPMNGIIVEENTETQQHHAVKIAKAICLHGDKMPLERKEQLITELKGYLKKSDVVFEEIEQLSLMEIDSSKIIKTHGEMVIEQITDYQAFVEMWRFHFLNHVMPKFMPEHWDPKRSIIRK